MSAHGLSYTSQDLSLSSSRARASLTPLGERQDMPKAEPNNPFPIIGGIDMGTGFAPSSGPGAVAEDKQVSRQYVPYTDIKGRIPHDRTNFSVNYIPSILTTGLRDQSGRAAIDPPQKTPAQFAGERPCDYYGIRLFCTCIECSSKLSELATQLSTRDAEIERLSRELDRMREICRAAVRKMRLCHTCHVDPLVTEAAELLREELAQARLSKAPTGNERAPKYFFPIKHVDFAESISSRLRAAASARSRRSLRKTMSGYLEMTGGLPSIDEHVVELDSFQKAVARLESAPVPSSPGRKYPYRSPDRMGSVSGSLTTTALGLGQSSRHASRSGSAQSSCITTPLAGSLTQTDLTYELQKSSVGTSVSMGLSRSPRRRSGSTSLVETQGSVFESDMQKRTELMYAAHLGDVVTVQRLAPVQAGTVDIFGRTALSYAAEFGHPECVQILKEAEARLVDNEGMTALMYAASFGHANVVKVLAPLEAGILRTADNATALMAAAANGQDECIPYLTEAEAGLMTTHGCTALMLAALCCHLACTIRLLPLERTLVTPTGRDALSFAREGGNELVIHELERAYRVDNRLV
ncbi:Ankyrin repeat protein 1 [Giardia muris]|uniref:Ankyrin repeat protein 1 n=1 Tax=Giardia muris TaxID=5742 RepID=A0A4Z1SXU1_GIAMU|nr:Ankyrin repeat protein 1 [Giardia muris]|eukprot:TNJ26503.1 Ankyrin repeat protein 1 [Giardia muris]